MVGAERWHLWRARGVPRGLLGFAVLATGLHGLGSHEAPILNAIRTDRPAQALFLGEWTGPSHSHWFHLKGGVYRVEERNQPLGCVRVVTLVTSKGRKIVALRPNDGPAVTDFKGGATWSGYVTYVGAGTYRIAGSAARSCRWWVRVTT